MFISMRIIMLIIWLLLLWLVVVVVVVLLLLLCLLALLLLSLLSLLLLSLCLLWGSHGALPAGRPGARVGGDSAFRLYSPLVRHRLIYMYCYCYCLPYTYVSLIHIMIVYYLVRHRLIYQMGSGQTLLLQKCYKFQWVCHICYTSCQSCRPIHDACQTHILYKYAMLCYTVVAMRYCTTILCYTMLDYAMLHFNILTHHNII